MAEPPRGPTDHNMSPAHPPRSVHPDQAPAPSPSRPPTTALNRSQAPSTAVPDTYGLNPATGQQNQNVFAAPYGMVPPLPPLPHPARASQANAITAYNPAPTSGPQAQRIPATPNVIGSLPLQNSAGFMHPNDSMAYPPPLVQVPTMNAPAPFMVPPGMRVGSALDQNDPWDYLGITPPGEPLRITRPHGRQTLGTLPVSLPETQPDGRASFIGLGRGLGGARPPSASPSHGAVSQRVGTAQSGRILPANANSPLRHPRPTPTVVAGPDRQSDSSFQDSQGPSSTLRNASTPHQASRQHHTNHLQQQFRPPASAMNNSHPQNSMPSPQNRRLPIDNQNASPTGQANVPAMINSSSPSDVQNAQGAPVAFSSLQRRADSIAPASEPARKRPRLDGAFSPAHLSDASDLPAPCVGETSGNGAAASQGAAPQPPGLKDFLKKRQEDARAEGKTPAIVRDLLPVQDTEELLPLDRNCAVCGLDLGSSHHPAGLAARLDHLELCMQRQYALTPSGPPPKAPLTDFWSNERMVRSISTSDLEIGMVSDQIHLQTSFDEASKVYRDPATSNAWKQRQLPFLQQAESDITKTNRDFPMHDETRELVFKRMVAASEEKKKTKELVGRAFEYGATKNITLAPESKDKLEEIPKNRGE